MSPLIVWCILFANSLYYFVKRPWVFKRRYKNKTYYYYLWYIMNVWMFWLLNVCPKQVLLPEDQKYMMGCLSLEFEYRRLTVKYPTFINLDMKSRIISSQVANIPQKAGWSKAEVSYIILKGFYCVYFIVWEERHSGVIRKRHKTSTTM